MNDDMPEFESYLRVAAPIEIATQVADVYSLYQDFVLIAKWCEMVKEADAEDGPDAGVVTLGLWRAACITYRRCWDPTGRSAIDKGKTRMNLLDSWIDDCGVEDARKTHGEVLKQADRNAAHRVDDSELYQVVVFLSRPSEPPAVKGVVTFGAVLTAPIDLVPRLLELSNALAGLLWKTVERGYDIIRDLAEKDGVENLYQWAEMPEPGDYQEFRDHGLGRIV